MIKINKSYKIIGVVVITALVIAGVMYMWHLSVVRSMKEQQQHIDVKYEKYIQALQLKDVIIKGLKARITQLEEEQQSFPGEVPGDLLDIYAYNSMKNVGGVSFYLATPEKYSLTQKLNLVANVLMKYHFKKGMIELKRIEDRNGKKIAIVELRETETNPWAWKGQYFQGSSGGQWTTYILVNTFLQPDYGGYWVDGVEFYYEGKPIANEWDHISLDGIKYRK